MPRPASTSFFWLASRLPAIVVFPEQLPTLLEDAELLELVDSKFALLKSYQFPRPDCRVARFGRAALRRCRMGRNDELDGQAVDRTFLCRFAMSITFRDAD